MNRNEEFIVSRIDHLKPTSRNYAQGTAVYYEGIDGEVKQSTVAASGGESTMLANGDWCYSWQLVAVEEIPSPVRI